MKGKGATQSFIAILFLQPGERVPTFKEIMGGKPDEGGIQMGDVILGVPAGTPLDPQNHLASLVRAIHYAEACQQEAIENLARCNAAVSKAIRQYREAEAAPDKSDNASG